VNDLLADFEDELCGGASQANLGADESFTFQDGGFFISAGGGGYNLPLDDDADFEALEGAEDDEDLTEATFRAYLPASSSLASLSAYGGQPRPACEAAHAEVNCDESQDDDQTQEAASAPPASPSEVPLAESGPSEADAAAFSLGDKGSRERE
ncbi:unnamed protein product, partial [Polarella glacialis]